MTTCDALLVPAAVGAALLMALGALALLAIGGWLWRAWHPMYLVHPDRGMQRIPDLVPADLLAAAERETARAEGLDASGEYRRHSVYAALLRQFPSASKRDLALAIELALR